MIYGIGVDIIEVERVKKSIEKFGDKFLSKIFSQEEIEYCQRMKNPYPNYAVRFAAKEAVVKALEIMPPDTDWRDVQVKKRPTGKPYLAFSENLEKFLLSKKIINSHISLSHSENYAIAQVILETK